MNKKHIVRLTDEERAICEATIEKERCRSEKLRRAMILLKADAEVKKALSDKELEDNFDLGHHFKQVDMHLQGSALH